MLRAIEYELSFCCVTPLYCNNSMQQIEQVSLPTVSLNKFVIINNVGRHFDDRRNLSNIQVASNYIDFSLPRHDVREAFTYSSSKNSNNQTASFLAVTCIRHCERSEAICALDIQKYYKYISTYIMFISVPTAQVSDTTGDVTKHKSL